MIYTDIYELIPNDSHKSFYGKAKVKKAIKEHSTVEILQSYDTDVLAVVYHEQDTPTTLRLWDGYSATMQRHIQAFNGMNKKDFTALPIQNMTDVEKCANERW